MSSQLLIESYVWHGEKCFFVSTSLHDSSAVSGPKQYSKTTVWKVDWDKDELGDLVGSEWSPSGLSQHFDACKILNETGVLP